MKSIPLSRARVAAAILLGLVGSGLLLLAIVGPRGKPGRERESLEEEKDRTDSPDEALKFRRMQLQDENGKIPLDGLLKAREHMAVMKAAQEKKAKALGKGPGTEVAGIGPGSWSWLGPGNIGGRIRSIVIDPLNANKMWVGSVSGGIWHSSDAGAHWLPVNDFMANLAVATMVMSPTNSSIIYAGTGEGFGNNDAIQGAGIFQSTDAGITWNLLPSTNPATFPPPPGCGVVNAAPPCPSFWPFVNRLAISPDGTAILAATNGGIAQSNDSGTTWIQRTNTPVSDVVFDPVNSGNAVAGELGTARYTIDGGQNWPPASFAPLISNGGTLATNGRVELAYARSNPQIVYASVNNNSGDLYRSGDGGHNFFRVNTTTNFLSSGGWYGNAVWVDPLDANTVIVGGIDLWRSSDGGNNLTQISDWHQAPGSSAHADHHAIVAHPGFNNTSNRIVYFGDDGGLYRADDAITVEQTSGWTNLNHNLGITQFFSGTSSASGVIFGGAQDNGTDKVVPQANMIPPYDPQSWSEFAGGDGGDVAADPVDPNYLYAEYINLTIRRSSDGGSSVSYIYCDPANINPPASYQCTSNTGITDAFNGALFVAPFVLDPSNANTMLAGGLSLWRSNDVKADVPTWARMKQPAPPAPPAPGASPNPTPPISAIAVSPNNSDFIVVGHNDGQVYLTFDGTGTNPSPTQQPPGQPCPAGFSPCWKRIDVTSAGVALLPLRFVTRLVIDNTRSPNWIYATFGGFSNDNIYVTKDLGVTWIDVSGVTGTSSDLPNVPVRGLTINPVRNNWLYVGTEVGIFASEDAGATWNLPQDGPANVSVDDLFWLNGNLVAATHGRGFYQTGAAVYVSTAGCTSACPCFGDWDCPCTWNTNQVPTANDDILTPCPVIAHHPVQARNIRVQNRLTLDGDLTVVGALANFGQIISNPGMVSNIFCHTLFNTHPSTTFPLFGRITLLGGISASGDVTNSGAMALGTSLNAINLSTTPDSTLTLNVVNVGGNLSNDGLIETQGAQGGINVRGNIANTGSLRGTFLALTAPASLVKNFSGAGVWNFSAFGIPVFYTVKLTSDVTFDIASFSNNGTLDFGDKTLNFTGGSFQGGGAVLGTGTLVFAPTGGSSIFNANGPAVTIASGTVAYQSGGTISGQFTISTGATFAMNTGGSLTANDNVTVNGTLSNTAANPVFVFNGGTFINNGSVGDIDFLIFNDTGAPKAQSIAGPGSWAPKNIQIGSPSPGTTTVTLLDNATFASNQVVSAIGSTLNVGNHTLTLTGPTNFFSGKIAGTGLVKMQPSSGTPRLGTPFATLTIDPALEIASGTVKSTLTTVGGKLTIDPGATLSLFGFVGLAANGDVLNNGTLNAFSDNPSLNFQGSTFTNNGVVTGSVFVNFGPQLGQNLAGFGSWAGSPRLLINSPGTTTLLNDVNYNGGNLYVDGRLNTDAFTLSLPCAVTWSGAGDVVGNIRRTNLAACPGAAIAYGNPFTTITFNSGTPPTEVSVNLALSAPPGFASAIARTYTITPTGGTGYTATLRLHYLDSELNGNNEATLQLLRQDGIGWNSQGATNRSTTNNWVEYANVTQFSPWTLSSLPPPPLPTTFANWRQGFFTPAELADPAISGDSADPDFDGLSNLLEYAFHGDPKQPSSTNRPYSGKDAIYFSLIYTKALAPTDLTYTIEQSSDLLTWFAVTPLNVILADNGITQTVKAQVPIMGAAKMSLRLRISH